MLLLICYYNLISFYMIQIPTVLQDQYVTCLCKNDLLYNIATAMVSLPNIVLPLLVSPLAEKIGIRMTILFYTVIMVLGFVLVYIGTFLANDANIGPD
jgi:MFS family permease